MQRKRYHLLKAYSRIIKQRRENREQAMEEQPTEEIEHEDEFEDEFEEEEAWVSASSGQEVEEGVQTPSDVYLGNNKGLKKGEVLEFENEAYDMLHRLTPQWPSLSIDIISTASPFDQGAFHQMQEYPYEVYTVQGSCNQSNHNSIYLTKLYNLYRTKYDDVPAELADENDEEAEVVIQEVGTGSDVRRIRTLNHSPVVGYWSDGGHVHILDLTTRLDKLRNNVGSKRREAVEETVIDVKAEGWALCWNPLEVGQLVVGSEDATLRIYSNNQSKWVLNATYTHHSGSVEDIVCSPTQSYVLATCSTDGTLQIVDTRVGNKAQMRIQAHARDVNVCDWNRSAQHLLVSGSDDCTVKVWDLRMKEELMSLKWHTEPITSVKFQPNDESTLAVASQDNRLSLWDLSAENQEKNTEIPNELMFLHQGQEEIKEIAFHPVYYQMVVSCALDSIAVFKPALDSPEEEDQKDSIRNEPIHQDELDQYIQKMNIS